MTKKYTFEDNIARSIEEIKSIIPKSYVDQEIRHGFKFNDYDVDWVNLFKSWSTSVHQEWYLEKG